MAKTKRRSRYSAEATLKRFFSKDPGADILSIDEIFVATDRGDKSREDNISWLSNILTALKFYGLVTTVYSYDGRKKLDRIRLTEEGRRAVRIGKENFDNAPVQEKLPISTEDEGDKVLLPKIMNLVTKLKEQNPEYEVIFDVKLKNKG